MRRSPEIDTPPASASAAAASSSSSPMESTVMQMMAKRTCCAYVSSLFAASGPQGWAELPDGVLQSIIALLSSFRDLLAFGATCRLWRDFFSAHLSSFQPLLLHPNVHTHSQRFLLHGRWFLFPECRWRLADPADPVASCHSLLSLSELKNMCFVGCSYGHLIFFHDKQFHLVDAFNGAKVVPPCLPSNRSTHNWHGTLTAPITSANSHLLVGDGSSLFHWHVGSDSWLESCLKTGGRIQQIVIFKGKIYAIGLFGGLFIIHLSPRLTVQPVEVVFEENRCQVLEYILEKACVTS